VVAAEAVKKPMLQLLKEWQKAVNIGDAVNVGNNIYVTNTLGSAGLMLFLEERAPPKGMDMVAR
jgi:hypothetical protein